MNDPDEIMVHEVTLPSPQVIDKALLRDSMTNNPCLEQFFGRSLPMARPPLQSLMESSQIVGQQNPWNKFLRSRKENSDLDM